MGDKKGSIHAKIPILDRFWGLVAEPNEHGCLLWIGWSYPGAYGQFRIDYKKHVNAHRFIWEQTYGEIPFDKHVLHSCDVFYSPGDTTYRLCVNIDHLWLGTHLENMQDKAAKGRSRNQWTGASW
jgi:hypothetical protein